MYSTINENAEALFSDWSNSAYDDILEFYDEAENIDLFADVSVIMKRLQNNLRIRPFSEYLKYCIYNHSELRTSAPDFSSVPNRKYFALIQKEFAAHGMENTASLDPYNPHELDRRFLYRVFGKENISRDIVFLFAFGLGMNLKITELFLTRVIRQTGFNFKDYREAIYYWCIRNNLGYKGLIYFLDIYEKLEPKESRFTEKSYTVDIEELFEAADCEADFIELLADIKKADLVPGLSRREIFISLINEYRRQILRSDGQIYYREDDTGLSEEDISLYNIEKYTYYPETRGKNWNMFPNSQNILKGKKWFLDTKLTRQSMSMALNGKRSITRNDIITLTFLNEDLWGGSHTDVRSLLNDYVSIANDYLLAARFTPFCFDSPYESFIAMCLISENPQDTYRRIWSESLSKKEETVL